MSEILTTAAHDERDPLTGLPGLASARSRLDAWAGDSPAHGMLLSLPRLPAINLAHGTKTGDAVLIETAARISHFAAAEFEGPWFAARAGGATFLLFAAEPLSRERWELLAHGLAERVGRSQPGVLPPVRSSPRIALVRAVPGEGADSLLDRLMQALSLLDRRGGRRLLWADGTSLRPDLSGPVLEAELAGAVARGEIEVLFQPQYALAPGNALTGAEALARWNHPRLGRIGAVALFTLAERADLLQPLSAEIMAEALAHASRWPAHLRLSLNITSGDIAAPRWADRLLGQIAASRFPAERLTLEVTEEALIADIAGAAETLGQLTASGVRLALDDFGAGFCNFRYLKLLPLHYLKLDRSLMDGIAEDGRDRAVLRGLVAMARALDLEVVAEGIEDEAQERAAMAEGCATMQGFLRGRPMSAKAFQAMAVADSDP
ncbi:MAG TPA: GGDEF domain-containing phosphodiesterase [Novosphingobium sp.]|nr:GGDEF domain-containing phosphodiesterase [Novosphingobium sp.]